MVDRGPGSTKLDPQAFRMLAAFLDRAVDDLGRRIEARTTAIHTVGRVGDGVEAAWQSPEAAAKALGIGALAWSASEPIGPLGDAVRALGDLAGEARRAALVLDEVEQYEKTWNEQLVANWSEWQDRITTAAVDVFSDDGGRSAALTAQYQEQTRRTEEASRRRAETLARWHERCGITAMAVHEATGALHRTVGVLGSGTRSAGAPTDPATARARLAVLAFRDLLGDHGPGLADQVAAVVAGLTTPELEAFLAALTPGERVRLLDLLPDEARPAVATMVGRQAASDVRRALRDAGINPDRFVPGDVLHLDPASEGYRRIVDELDAAGQLLGNAEAATAYYGALGVEGTRAALGAIDHGLADLAHRDAPSSAREPLWDVLGMHISGFADTSARPELAGLRAGLLDIEHEWQRHQLGLLLGASGARYEPAFLARATETILSRTTLGLDLPQFGVRASRDSAMGPEAVRRLHEQQYPGLVERYSLYRDVDLANPEVAALRALGQNPVAAFDFVTNPDGSVHQDNLTVLLKPFGVTRLRELSFANALGESDSHPSVRELIARSERYSADVVRTVLTTDEALTGASQEQHVALLDAAIEQVGSGDASIAAKRAVTGSMHPYLDEMMRIIAAQEQATDASQRGLFDRPDVVAFFREISGDEQSVRMLGTTLGLYTQAVTATIMDSPPDQYALHYAKLHNTARLMGALSDGFELSEKDTSENAGLLSAGANTAFSAGVEVGLMALPGAAAPVAEILRGAAGVLIDKAVGDGDPGQPMTAGTFRTQLTNNLERFVWAHGQPGTPPPKDENFEAAVEDYLRKALGHPAVLTKDFESWSRLEMIDPASTPETHWNNLP